jgi:hypothetical protein
VTFISPGRPLMNQCLQEEELFDVHRTNAVVQHVGKCDDSQQSTLFTTLSFFLVEALVHQWILENKC